MIGSALRALEADVVALQEVNVRGGVEDLLGPGYCITPFPPPARTTLERRSLLVQSIECWRRSTSAPLSIARIFHGVPP